MDLMEKVVHPETAGEMAQRKAKARKAAGKEKKKKQKQLDKARSKRGMHQPSAKQSKGWCPTCGRGPAEPKGKGKGARGAQSKAQANTPLEHLYEAPYDSVLTRPLGSKWQTDV